MSTGTVFDPAQGADAKPREERLFKSARVFFMSKLAFSLRWVYRTDTYKRSNHEPIIQSERLDDPHPHQTSKGDNQPCYDQEQNHDNGELGPAILHLPVPEDWKKSKEADSTGRRSSHKPDGGEKKKNAQSCQPLERTPEGRKLQGFIGKIRVMIETTQS